MTVGRRHYISLEVPFSLKARHDTPEFSRLDRDHPSFPSALRELHDGPDTLFIKGNADLLSRPMIAVVGSRQASRQGCLNAFSLSQALSRRGITVISGLARGIDAAAHKGALTGQGSTVAILGTGIDRIYPAFHDQLAVEIAEKGLLVSSFPPGAPPEKWHFPRRNRIIAALSLGCVVVEASLTSGSIITARIAADLGREVFALPGSIHSPLSRGCHQLLREGAQLVETVHDILSEIPDFRLLARQPDLFPPVDGQAPSLGKEEARVLDLLTPGPLTTDQICQGSGLTSRQVSLMLITLELLGHVAPLPGGRFERLVINGYS